MSDEIVGGIVVMDVSHAKAFKHRVPEIFDALIECSGFVNNRYADDNSHLYVGFIG
jgi:hypothetical protein